VKNNRDKTKSGVPIKVHRLTYFISLSRCDFIEGVVLPYSIIYISDKVFVRCTSLTTITIPNTVIGIAPAGLSECPALVNIIFIGGYFPYTPLPTPPDADPGR
jgi:hypothetical protein